MSLFYSIDNFDDVNIYKAVYITEYTTIDVGRVEVDFITTVYLYSLDSANTECISYCNKLYMMAGYWVAQVTACACS